MEEEGERGGRGRSRDGVDDDVGVDKMEGQTGRQE